MTAKIALVPRLVIASAAKQSREGRVKRLSPVPQDCFVASLLAMTGKA